MGAKIINPKRKCNGRLDLKKHLSRVKTENLDENTLSAKLALEHLEWERAVTSGNYQTHFMFPHGSKKNLLYFKGAKILGHLLGHALYHSIVEMRVSPSEVRSIFYHNFTSSEEARQLYFAWIRRLDVFNYRDSVKWERL